MRDVESLRLEIRHLLDRGEKWLKDGLRLELDDDDVQEEVVEAASIIRQLRIRTTSSLLNVAFLGGFSSGKSFLIGGLQNQLEYAPVTTDDGMVSDQYIGLLHSAAKASTACPATVVPVEESDEYDVSDRGFMRVRFDGHDEWEDIGNSPMPGPVAAYTTQDPRAIADFRPARHRHLKVAEVEILLQDALVPAKLYDLPGHGAPNPEHERIANEAWKAADCFVYTVQATHSLSSADLELILRLYQHHLDSGKPVVWVMTGIDRAAMLNYNQQPEWKDALETNNDYLRQQVKVRPGQVDTFVGINGFLAVSPAWEAMGKRYKTDGDASKGNQFIAASRMDQLRHALIDLIEAGAGQRHIATIAIEARTLVLKRYQALVGLLDSARLSLDQISRERDDLGRRATQLAAATATVRDHLNAALRDHIQSIDRSFGGLSSYLHQELDDEIGAANLTRERETVRLEMRKAEALNEWATNRGPMRAWEVKFKDFLDDAWDVVRTTLRNTEPSEEMAAAAAARVDLEQLTVPPSQKYRTSTQDIVQTISGFLGISTPVATAVATGIGIISGPALLVPAAVTVLAGVAYTVIRGRRSKVTALGLLRKEWIDGLNHTARYYRDAFLTAAQTQGTQIMDRVGELLSERREDMSRRIILLERRLAEPEYADRSDLVARLEPYCRTGQVLLAELKAIARN
jgi:hypothetical protein